jgi:tetratricopeptide (TPR) repeat protein
MADTKKWIPIALIVAGLCAYANSFGGPFIFDDIASIRNNPHLRKLSHAFTAPAQTTVAGRPVLALSLAINYALGGLNVWGYHAFNLAVHIGNALLLLGIVRRTSAVNGVPEGRSGLAAAVALLWLVHPLATGSVTYIIQRAESLMALFYLLTLYSAIRGWNVMAVVACALGMATKETMATAPLMVGLYDWVFGGQPWRETRRRRWRLYAGLGATWLVLAVLVAQGARTQSVGFGLENVSAWDYARTQFGVVLHYLRLAMWPHPLVLDYFWPIAKTSREWVPAAMAMAILLGAIVWALRRRSWIGFCGAWFLVILLPSSSIVPVVTEVAAEHRTYLAVLGIIVPVTVALVRWTRTTIPVVVIAGVLGVLTFARNADYRTEVSIWADTVAKRPNNPRAHNNLGNALLAEGKPQDAIAHFREALQLEPNFAIAHNNYGNALKSLGQTEDAIAHFTEAIRLKPGSAEAHVNVGIVLAEQGKLDEAFGHLTEAVRLEPASANAHYNLGVILARQGKATEALRHFETAIRFNPDYQLARDALADLRARLAAAGR